MAVQNRSQFPGAIVRWIIKDDCGTAVVRNGSGIPEGSIRTWTKFGTILSVGVSSNQGFNWEGSGFKGNGLGWSQKSSLKRCVRKFLQNEIDLDRRVLWRDCVVLLFID
ncbi:hypothetical protein AVEN_264725-1 [Araneus ventricosus]|uniref:Uncharacterized protein n=1 Tax=Araneus ventricosus TaxID=182803 RepID=A0A4Y2NHW1_ARAVE|nr:hypothetical protein AVEN_264725-1 [Araneus ventricosus]